MIKFILILWLGTVYSFVAVMNAKRLRIASRLTTFWYVHLLPLAVVGLVFDALFNILFGSVMFLERPREWLFSARVQRHYKTEGWRGRLAGFWKTQLNAIDAAEDDDDGEAHIHEPRS